ncbi:Fur family transcriptional regulator [Desulfovibrio inopinatus]|uniref:Fur family transcriptional regulator n=1 Tax=Desulfovibrio inopinatus TaxID=102109 RepID=UPI0004021ABB|nr:transcriptional repressor [Desulfovibrio inopinatus]
MPLEDVAEQRLRHILDRLAAHGRRLTPQRMAILRVLAVSEGHPSAEHVHQAILKDFPMTSLATVYKTIQLLKDEGEILELGFSDQDNRYDGAKPYPHPHVICLKCGAIMDFEDVDVEGLNAQVAKQTGFFITTQRLDFYGVCPACRS